MEALGGVLFLGGILGIVLICAYSLLEDDLGSGLLIIVALAIMLSGNALMSIPRSGSLNKGKLQTNAIYETVVAKEDGGKVVAILRKQNGELRAYILKKLPPPVFKVVENDDNPYQPYPPAK